MFSWLRPVPMAPVGLLTSSLYDDSTFFAQFARDLRQCRHEVIIESPFATGRRVRQLMPILQILRASNVRVVVNTRNPEEHTDRYMRDESRQVMPRLQQLGVYVLYTTGHHRKLAILDRKILYEGSLNILSQHNSCEVMRRIESPKLAWEMARFIKIDKFMREEL